MELKPYQRDAISDLTEYLDMIQEDNNYIGAFDHFWGKRGFPGLGAYQDVVPGTACVCFKVPTGGGKTFLASAALKPIFDWQPPGKIQAVVWLVPRDEIMRQTLKTLKDPAHPYRQRLNADFSGRVEVYTKDELLAGQNFSPLTIREQLSIMVLSYDSFRRTTKDGIRAYRENGNLRQFPEVFGPPDTPIAETDETALYQVINQLHPVVVVDESHHAKSGLSLEMLRNFAPSFVLELTATPKKESNILTYVSSVELKRENMVKLPLVVYQRQDSGDVVRDAIRLRDNLEDIAAAGRAQGGEYIRPIVLFQAQQKNNRDAETFEKVKHTLVTRGIPEEQIAIRTGQVNELKDVDLMSEECPVRYIVTVNALKEGWDCPFAYILASIANRSSLVDVEQIVGRILRQPYATHQTAFELNLSYVLTSSQDFKGALDKIVAGLTAAGFSRHDCRAEGIAEDTPVSESKTVQTAMLPPEAQESGQEPEPAIPGSDGVEDWEKELKHTEQTELQDKNADRLKNTTHPMLDQARQANEEYIKSLEDHPAVTPLPGGEKMPYVHMKPNLEEQARQLRLPVFAIKTPEKDMPLFVMAETPLQNLSDFDFSILSPENLMDDFQLSKQNIEIDFKTDRRSVVRVDVEESGEGVPHVYAATEKENQRLLELFRARSDDEKRIQCEKVILRSVENINGISQGDLNAYVKRVVASLNESELESVFKEPERFGLAVCRKIVGLMDEHHKDTFVKWCKKRKIYTKATWQFPSGLRLTNKDDMFGRSLYEAEESMNGMEEKLALAFSGIENVLWWHRNLTNRSEGFRLNGFKNHYPDFIVCTKNGTLLLVETKGAHLAGSKDTLDKLLMGRQWEHLAGNGYRYCMVFEDDVEIPEDAWHWTEFLGMIQTI